MRWENEQAKNEEHGYLHEPRKAVVEAREAALVHEVAVADDQAGDVDGEETIAVEEGCASVNQEHERGSEDRVKAFVIEGGFG